MSDTNGVTRLCLFCRGKGCRQCLDTPEARAFRRERGARGGRASTGRRAEAIRERLAKLKAPGDPEGALLVSLVLRPDLRSADSRRTFREAIARAVVLGAIERQDAAILLQAARDQSGEDEPKRPEEGPPTILIRRYGPESAEETDAPVP
jgi:hypothetical protein